MSVNFKLIKLITVQQNKAEFAVVGTFFTNRLPSLGIFNGKSLKSEKLRPLLLYQF